MRECLKESFKREKGSDLFRVNLLKRVIVLNLLIIHLDSISSPQTFESSQPSRLGMSPSSSAFRDRMMSERCPHCNQFHLGVYNMPQGICFQCGQIGHVKKYCSLLNSIGSTSQSSVQPSISGQGFGR